MGDDILGRRIQKEVEVQKTLWNNKVTKNVVEAVNIGKKNKEIRGADKETTNEIWKIKEWENF